MDKRTKNNDLDAAIALLIDTWTQDCWITLERSGAACLRSPFAAAKTEPSATLVQRVKAQHELVREILSANKKDWAERRDEFAFAPVIENGRIVRAGLVLIEQRRAIGPGVVITDPTKAPSRFKTCNGVIIHQGVQDKEAIAWWLWEMGLLRSDVYIIEVPETPGEDYRDVISGSHWLKSSVRPAAGDAAGQALFTAMQARSFRKEAIRASRTAWWQALAAAHLARREKISGEEACARLKLGWQQMQAWIEKALSFQPRRRPETTAAQSSARPVAQPAGQVQPEATHTPPVDVQAPTTSQRALMQKLITEQPLLANFAPRDWDKDRKEASRWITRAIAASNRLKDALARHRTEVAEILEAEARG